MGMCSITIMHNASAHFIITCMVTCLDCDAVELNGYLSRYLMWKKVSVVVRIVSIRA